MCLIPVELETTQTDLFVLANSEYGNYAGDLSDIAKSKFYGSTAVNLIFGFYFNDSID